MPKKTKDQSDVVSVLVQEREREGGRDRVGEVWRMRERGREGRRRRRIWGRI